MTNSGMFFRGYKPQSIQEAIWWEEQCVRRQGGYDLDTSNLPENLQWLPKGVVFKLNKEDGKAVVLKTCKVVADAKSGSTTLEVATNHLLKVGDALGNIAITGIAHAADKDTLTVSTLSEDIKNGAVLSDLKGTDIVLGFSYDTLDVLFKDSFYSVTPTLQVMEVEEDSLPYPINDDIKDAINKYGIARFRIG